jgi:hypothetical protein
VFRAFLPSGLHNHHYRALDLKSSTSLSRLAATRPHLLWVGFAEAIATIALLTAIWTSVGKDFDYPSPETLRSIANVGVALLLAYVLEAVWMVNRAERKEWHENWLGTICGTGFGGLLGIGIALATAAHLESGHKNLLDDLGLWWSVVSLSLLGVMVTLQPLMTDRVRRKPLPAAQGDADEGEEAAERPAGDIG